MTANHEDAAKAIPELTPCQKDFEAWLHKEGVFTHPYDLSRDDAGNYIRTYVAHRYDGFQGAWNTRAAPPEQTPMPIENAPKDGKRVDLYLNDTAGARIPDCYFCVDEQEWRCFGTDVPVLHKGDPFNRISHFSRPPEKI